MRIVDPGSLLSYDEAMILFMGRAPSLVSASHKPIKEGYECMVLATPGHAHAYVYSFYILGRRGSLDGPASRYQISNIRLRQTFQLSPTNYTMVHLASMVPTVYAESGESRNLALYADNRFWNVPTMAFLRTMNIGGCGSFRSNAQGQPQSVKSELCHRNRTAKSYKWADTSAWNIRSFFFDR